MFFAPCLPARIDAKRADRLHHRTLHPSQNPKLAYKSRKQTGNNRYQSVIERYLSVNDRYRFVIERYQSDIYNKRSDIDFSR